ncbi:energy-coupling factor transporter transmembrane component T family protein [Desulfovibrio litoralis]|uniref:Cobalt/nickel transport system permease protein n=1 Tax=Desulfovibrio litoralis DSM 11393 TaxID=1121455 RepID=A0A1M7S6F1_9BACT|nr:energy-coupling factor transporter transmembrane component T [Desulfovibrio litoralis]SHN54003.1 cobalt/nickel transport system permease protein [Desulfovibrio litoralis DSM 11393]
MELNEKIFCTPQASFLLNFDPRAKILATLFLSLAVVFSVRLSFSAVLLALAFVLAFFCSVNFPRLFKMLLTVNLFLIFTWLTLPFSFSEINGNIHLFSSLYLDLNGFYFCLLTTLKVNATAVFLFVFTQGLDSATLASALQSLRVSPKLCTVFVMMCRHVIILIEEFICSLRALRLRTKHDSLSLTFVKRIKRNLKTYAFFIGSVLVQSANRAEKVRFAMLTRGYTYIFNPYLKLNWGIKESCLVVGSLIPFLSIIYLNVANS